MLRRTKGRTVTVRVRGRPEVVRMLEYGCQASAGPHPNITGMRKKYWGEDAFIVRAGAYAYYMGRDEGQGVPI